MNSRFVVTGGPGAGKTTLLNALAQHGYRFAPESARRIIKERMSKGLSPRPGAVSFASETLRSDIEQYRYSSTSAEPVFYDRGVLDALYMLDAANALPLESALGYVEEFQYNKVVFFLPPWEEIYSTDTERDQTFQEALEVFEGMRKWYLRWGYQPLEVPPGGVENRVNFILENTHGILSKN